MKLKGLVLGTAAGALAVTGAQAADLPVAPEPIDYVRVCDAFGPGYYFIPGTDTCLRVAGRVRADYNYFMLNEDFVALGAGAFGTSTRSTNAYRFRARAYIYMDSRTNTEFGLLRTFTEVFFTGDYGGGSLFAGEPPAGIGASESTVGTALNRAFIQFGGLTFGRTQSFYDFVDATYAAGQFFTASYSDATTNVIAYTFAFGNGFSASISLEDEGYRRLQGFGATRFDTYNADGDLVSVPGNVVYAGNRFPDIVGNIRVDQGWGSAQIMGAGHNVSVVQTVTGLDQNGNPIGLPGTQSEYGWAVGAGVNVDVPFGTGTSVGIQGGYTQGALRYASDNPIGGTVTGFNNVQGVLNYRSTAGDFVIDANGNLELVTAWNVSGGFTTSFTPTISFAMQAGYLDVETGTLGDIDGDGFIDNGDFSNFDVQAFLSYTPVSGFVLGVGAEYKYVDLDDNTFVEKVGNRQIRRTGDDPEGLSVFFRAQRTF